MFSFLYSTLYAMGQQRIKREKRDIRRRIVSNAEYYIKWCQDNVVMREDGVERPVSIEEAVEFILLTTQEANDKLKATETPDKA